MADVVAEGVRDTSRAAVEEIADSVPLLRAKALRAVQSSTGMTADEVAAALGLSALSIRPRMTELAQRNVVADCGLRRANVSGRKAIVWVAVEAAGRGE